MMTEVTAYKGIFDEYKVTRLSMAIWCSDNDDVTKANAKVATFRTCYDPDARGQNVTPANILKMRGATRSTIRPFETKYLTLRPEYHVQSMTTGEGMALYGRNRNPWRDVANLEAVSTVRSTNSVLYTVEGPVSEEYKYEKRYYVTFRGMRNGQAYIPLQAEDPNIQHGPPREHDVGATSRDWMDY